MQRADGYVATIKRGRRIAVDGELTGDVDLESALGVASLITPHRRGVGPMTIIMLMANTLRAARLSVGLDG